VLRGTVSSVTDTCPAMNTSRLPSHLAGEKLPMALWTLYHRFVGDQRYDRARPRREQAVGRCLVDAAVATLIEEKSVCLPEPTWWSLLLVECPRSRRQPARGM